MVIKNSNYLPWKVCLETLGVKFNYLLVLFILVRRKEGWCSLRDLKIKLLFCRCFFTGWLTTCWCSYFHLHDCLIVPTNQIKYLENFNELIAYEKHYKWMCLHNLSLWYQKQDWLVGIFLLRKWCIATLFHVWVINFEKLSWSILLGFY